MYTTALADTADIAGSSNSGLGQIIEWSVLTATPRPARGGVAGSGRRGVRGLSVPLEDDHPHHSASVRWY